MKFIASYISELIKRNPAKLIILFFVFIFYQCSINIDNDVSYYGIVEQFESNGIYIYVTKLNDEIKILYYDKPIKEKVGEIHIKYDASGFVVISVIMVCFLLFIALLLPMGEEGEWEFKNIYWYCCVRQIEICKDVKHVYFVYDGKVIRVCDRSETRLYEIQNFLDYNYVSMIKNMKEHPNMYEDYKGTRSEIRDNKIRKLIG